VGLDIYVGSFTRYYAHDWETVVQQAGRLQGTPVVVVRSDSSPDPLTDPSQIRSSVVQWRDLMLEALRGAGSQLTSLEWDERAEAPYFTDKPGWDCFGALLLLAAYEDAPKPLFGDRYLKELPPDWPKDGRLKRATASRGRGYSHLVGCEVWLPLDFKDPFDGPKPNAKMARFGSTLRLHEQLLELNRRTYDGTPGDLAAWRHEPPDPEDRSFEPMAKSGLAIVVALAEAANENRLPMLLDY
jgi:hypothetical protein